jgi:hypothetical protein
VQIHFFFNSYFFEDGDGNTYCWLSKSNRLKNLKRGDKIKVTSYKKIGEGNITMIKNVRFKVLTD